MRTADVLLRILVLAPSLLVAAKPVGSLHTLFSRAGLGDKCVANEDCTGGSEMRCRYVKGEPSDDDHKVCYAYRYLPTGVACDDIYAGDQCWTGGSGCSTNFCLPSRGNRVPIDGACSATADCAGANTGFGDDTTVSTTECTGIDPTSTGSGTCKLLASNPGQSVATGKTCPALATNCFSTKCGSDGLCAAVSPPISPGSGTKCSASADCEGWTSSHATSTGYCSNTDGALGDCFVTTIVATDENCTDASATCFSGPDTCTTTKEKYRTCAPPATLVAEGGACSATADCDGGAANPATAECQGVTQNGSRGVVAGKCVKTTPGTTAVVASGATCDATHTCWSGTCTAGKCPLSASVAEGGACSADGDCLPITQTTGTRRSCAGLTSVVGSGTCTTGSSNSVTSSSTPLISAPSTPSVSTRVYTTQVSTNINGTPTVANVVATSRVTAVGAGAGGAVTTSSAYRVGVSVQCGLVALLGGMVGTAVLL